MVPVALMPLAIGRAIDAAIQSGLGPQLWTWIAAILTLGLLQALGVGFLEFWSTQLWIQAGVRVQRAVLEHAARLGSVLPRQIRAGDVVAVGSTDVYSIGNLLGCIGRTAGSLVAFIVVATVLVTQSPLLGAVVLVGVPLATLGMAPLFGPLRRRAEAHRDEVGAATSLAADIVSGLRVLRGIGGERRFGDRYAETSQRVRMAGVAAGRTESWLSALELLLPGLVTVGVTWLGARLASSGDITVGELVGFYGASAFLVIPVSIASDTVTTTTEALVSAGRVTTILNLRPALDSPPNPTPLSAGPLGLDDPDTGLHCPPGRLTVITPSGPGDELADRLGRFVETPVLAGGVPLAEADLGEVRRRILVAHNQDVLFSGRLAAEIGLGGSRVDLEEALWATDAKDIVDGLPDGIDERLAERGRQLSGGQRQRLMLARALTMDPDVLLLDDPTSAVDAHTESRIVRRVAALRKGRTTVVISHSPLWAAVADHRTSDQQAKEPTS